MTDATNPETGVELTNDEDIAARYLEITGQADQPDETDDPQTDEEAAEGSADAEPDDEQTEPDETDDDPDETESDDEDEPEDEPLYEITVNGETQQVTLDELRGGYQRNADYTRKTQELAERRKDLDTVGQYAEQVSQLYKQRLAQVGSFLEQSLPPEPDEKLLAEDPFAYQQQQLLRQKAEESLKAVYGQFEAAQVETQARQDELLRDAQQRAVEELPEKIPEWKDTETIKKGMADLTRYLRSEGFEAHEMRDVSDPRLIVVLEKARRYDAAKKSAESSKKKAAAKPPKSLKPGKPSRKSNARKSDVRKAQERMKKTGSPDDAAAFYMQKYME